MKTVLIIILILACCSCSWQGQKHQTFDPATQKQTLNAEFWSMRFLWISSGVEISDITPYWSVNGGIAESKSDPNSIKASGSAAGQIIGAAVK